MRSKIIRRGAALLVLLAASGIVQAGDPNKGRGLYEKHCSGCHGWNGTPQVPDVPNFTMGEGLMKSDQDILAYTKRGGTVMPGYDGLLSDDQILDIIAHMRTFF